MILNLKFVSQFSSSLPPALLSMIPCWCSRPVPPSVPTHSWHGCFFLSFIYHVLATPPASLAALQGHKEDLHPHYSSLFKKLLLSFCCIFFCLHLSVVESISSVLVTQPGSQASCCLVFYCCFSRGFPVYLIDSQSFHLYSSRSFLTSLLPFPVSHSFDCFCLCSC